MDVNRRQNKVFQDLWGATQDIVHTGPHTHTFSFHIHIFSLISTYILLALTYITPTYVLSRKTHKQLKYMCVQNICCGKLNICIRKENICVYERKCIYGRERERERGSEWIMSCSAPQTFKTMASSLFHTFSYNQEVLFPEQGLFYSSSNIWKHDCRHFWSGEMQFYWMTVKHSIEVTYPNHPVWFFFVNSRNDFMILWFIFNIHDSMITLRWTGVLQVRIFPSMCVNEILTSNGKPAIRRVQAGFHATFNNIHVGVMFRCVVSQLGSMATSAWIIPLISL